MSPGSESVSVSCRNGTRGGNVFREVYNLLLGTFVLYKRYSYPAMSNEERE